MMDLHTLLSQILFKEELSLWLQNYDLPYSGNKDDLIQRLISSEDFDIEDLPEAIYKEDLQNIADLFNLPRSGTKDEIWDRVKEVIDDVLDNDEDFQDVTGETEEIDVSISENDQHSVEVTEIRYLKIQPLKARSSILELNLTNHSDKAQILKFWQIYSWIGSSPTMNPPFKIKPQSTLSRRIIYQTPNDIGTHIFQVKLLDENDIEVDEQSYVLEINVDKSKTEKLISMVSQIGKILVNKL